MISQLDPMINACKSGYYEEKRETIGLIREKEELSQSKGDVGDSVMKDVLMIMRQESVNSSFFECSICNKLITIENFTKILDRGDSKICY